MQRGNVQWRKTYGSEGGAKSIQQTKDGGYIVAGYAETLVQVVCSAWVIKLDAKGNVQWRKTYGEERL